LHPSGSSTARGGDPARHPGKQSLISREAITV
jgi:hypothetical protein